jgi:hypothetical protein
MRAASCLMGMTVTEHYRRSATYVDKFSKAASPQIYRWNALTEGPNIPHRRCPREVN